MADNNPGLSTMPFNARREALVVKFAYHSPLKLDRSGNTQISASRVIARKSKKKVKTGRIGLPLTTRPLSDPSPLHGGCGAFLHLRG